LKQTFNRRVEFEAESQREYFDMLPFYKLHLDLEEHIMDLEEIKDKSLQIISYEGYRGVQR